MKQNAESMQNELLKESESKFVEKFIFPNIGEEKGIFTNRFKEKDWCLLCFMIDNYDNSLFEFETEDFSDCFENQYKNWLSESNIKMKKSGISFDSTSREKNSNLRNIVDNLCGLVKMDNDCIRQGEKFESFVDLLYEDNERNIESIKKRLSAI